MDREGTARPEQAEALEAGLEGDLLDVDALKARGDLQGLLDLAKAYRSGTAPGGRDLRRCLDAYSAAAELGSPEAEYAVALFYVSGGVVDRDLKEAAMRLRAAADKGSLPAKVYLGNLYELGVHYKADPEKADVWYRNAARGAGIDAEPGSPEHARALAELGCVRYVLDVVEHGGLSADEKARLLQRARAHGHGLRADALPVPTPRGRDANEADAVATGDAPTAAKTEPAKAGATAKRSAKTRTATSARRALEAFGFAALFVAAGTGAGYAGMLGAEALAKLLPGIGARTELVFPLALGLIGVLPTILFYRLATVVKALAAAALLGGVGWVAWGTGQAVLHPSRAAQAVAFGLAGFLALLLVLGLRGGTKPPGS